MEQILAAAISALASVVAAVITVQGARRAADHAPHDTNASPSPPPSTTIGPTTHNLKIWGLICATALVWILLSPKLIHGVLIGPNWLLVIPAITLAAAFFWPVKATLSLVFVFFLHAVNMLMSAFFREIWEKDVDTYTIITLVGIIAVNGVMVSLIASIRTSVSHR